MFPPYEDEIITSWIYRLARANDMKINEFSGLYLLNQKMNRLRGLFWIQKNIMGFPSADELLLRHTLIPFLAQDISIHFPHEGRYFEGYDGQPVII